MDEIENVSNPHVTDTFNDRIYILEVNKQTLTLYLVVYCMKVVVQKRHVCSPIGSIICMSGITLSPIMGLSRLIP